MRPAVATVSLLLMAGCTGDYTATKLGATNEQLSADLFQCAKSTGAPVNVGHDPSSPIGMHTDDPLLGAAMFECLKEKGYTITAK
jgi:hypothetical protein